LRHFANHFFAFFCKNPVMRANDNKPAKTRSKRLDRQLLHSQLQGHCTNAKPTAIANLFNGTVTCFVFAQTLSPYITLIGLALLIVLVAWRYGIAREFAALQNTGHRLERIARKVRWNAISLGSFWGWASGGMLLVANPTQVVFAAIIGSGMIGAGSITFRTYDRAAISYVLSAVPGCLFGLLWHGNAAGYASSALLFCYAVVLIVNIRATARIFNLNFERQKDEERSSETIRLLLNDFTEQGADWLFELDADGLIIDPSLHLSEATQRDLDALEGASFVALLDDSPDAQSLAGYIAEGAAFRHLIVSLTVNHAPRWWSISARPTTDGDITFRGVVTDITAQRQAEQKVSYMAHYDGLTDLPNRFLFNESLYHALNKDGAVGLMYLDLDHFKAVNDTLGHPVGDKLLMAVARRLEGCVGKQETVARLGGDEFAILIPFGRRARMDNVAKRIIKAMDEPFSLGDHNTVIGTSIGMVRAPDQAQDVDALFRNADLALYAAKAQGRNLAFWFEPEMDEAAQKRRQIEVDLRAALGGDELRLHYQPMVNVASGQTTGYEALIRWQQPERGSVMPDDFIPIAEETGMIVQIGEWVIRQALHDLQSWPSAMTVSVNLSPSQMRSPTLLSTVVNALAQTGVRPGRLCLEITESVLMQDSDANIDMLHKLRALGVHIALDDFGTGYSSLNYLRSFPFSKIKIDRCFVDEIDSREDCRAIVRSVVTLAKSLGMSTVAEGVENVEQLDWLRAEGCDEVQGFLYSPAVPAAELSDLRSIRTRKDAVLIKLEDARARAAAFDTRKQARG
jgi:diguanylate cyclase (GGDEF)-like protein